MSSSSSHEQLTGVDSTRLASLLECGLLYIREGRHAEGVVLLSMARTQLAEEQISLAAALDAFTQGYLNYWQAQQGLQQAGKRFVEAEIEQQNRVSALESLLSTLLREKQIDTSAPPLPPPHNPLATTTPILPSSNVNPSAFSATRYFRELPPLQFICFGHFQVQRDGQPIILCSNRKGQVILRYLITQTGQRATIDALMALLWPDDDVDTAHHKLQVAISALRRALSSGCPNETGGGYILCKNHAYQLNSAAVLSTDVDEFLALYQAGQRKTGKEATTAFEKACHLYTGPYLVEDLYADWSFIRREQLSQIYLTMCKNLAEYYMKEEHYTDAIRWSTAVLTESRCDETAHCQLISAYMAQGRRSEALRQYQRCQQTLQDELGVQPMPATTALFHQLMEFP